MYDFDATNILSDDKYYGFEESLDKAKYLEDHKKTWTNKDKVRESKNNILNKDNPKQKGRSDVPIVVEKPSFNYSSKADVNKQITKLSKQEKSKRNMISEAEITTLPNTITKTQRGTLPTVSQKDANGMTTMQRNSRMKYSTIKDGFNPKYLSKSKNHERQTLILEVPGLDVNPPEKPSTEIIYPLHSDALLKSSKQDNGKMSGSPYVVLLASSTAVLAVAVIVLVTFYIYKRRHRGTPVISDEMYNTYKLNKKMESRSPLPSPRGSEQGVSCNYDFITGDEVSPTSGPWEETEFQESDESIYIELDDSVRYDYATAPSSIVTTTTEQRL